MVISPAGPWMVGLLFGMVGLIQLVNGVVLGQPIMIAGSVLTLWGCARLTRIGQPDRRSLRDFVKFLFTVGLILGGLALSFLPLVLLGRPV